MWAGWLINAQLDLCMLEMIWLHCLSFPLAMGLSTHGFLRIELVLGMVMMH